VHIYSPKLVFGKERARRAVSYKDSGS
jgi:hypothetical protein